MPAGTSSTKSNIVCRSGKKNTTATATRAGSTASAARRRRRIPTITSHKPGLSMRPDYSRQQSLKEIGAAGQSRLAQSRVLIIGAGGLGSPVLQYLAGAGVGCIGIVDADALDASNLHRQPLYALADVGQSKVALAQ